MAAVEMARNELIGVRLAPEELGLLDRLVAHFTAQTPGVKFTRQMIVKLAIARVARDEGVDGSVPAPAPSRPRPKSRKPR